MTTKAFPTDAVLSAVTGVLVSPIGGIYEVLSWMTGESVYTHQLPRIGKEAAQVVLALHPELAQAYAEVKEVNPDNWRHWRDTWIARYGATLSVPKLTIDQHERIDPISELAESVHPDRIIVVGRTK
jgi:hypothetical protein